MKASLCRADRVDQVCVCDYNVITMKTSIITIGNSKGIRIPKPLLEESGLGTNVDIRARKGEIVIVPAPDDSRSLNEEYVLSLSTLSEWNDKEEDEAWAHLQ
jgi:antitoxin MazE